MTAKAATMGTRWKRRSSAFGTGPRRTRRRTASGPITSASAANRSQRETSSFQVAAPAPTASVGGGASTPTPKVNTPAGEWPSPPVTRQRTVYAAPRASPETGATTTVPSRATRARPESTRPFGDRTRMASLPAVTAELKRRRISVGGTSTRDCVAGDALLRDACAAAEAGTTSAAAVETARRRQRFTARPRCRRGGRRSARDRGRRRAVRRSRSTSARTRPGRPRASARGPARAGRAPRR